MVSWDSKCPSNTHFRISPEVVDHHLFKILKRFLHPKMKMLSLITYPHVVPNPYKLCSSSGHYSRYFGWNREACDCTAAPHTFWLNHWWQMDYFDDTYHTFLGLDSAIYLAVNRILNCVLKTNEASTGLERIHNSCFSHRLLSEPSLPICRIRKLRSTQRCFTLILASGFENMNDNLF